MISWLPSSFRTPNCYGSYPSKGPCDVTLFDPWVFVRRRRQRRRNLEIWESGNLKIWEPGNLEIWDPNKKSNKHKILEIKIRVAQNVGKVWIRTKIILAPFHAISGHFCEGQTHQKHVEILSILLGGPMGPIHPVWVLVAIHPWWRCVYPKFLLLAT